MLTLDLTARFTVQSGKLKRLSVLTCVVTTPSASNLERVGGGGGVRSLLPRRVRARVAMRGHRSPTICAERMNKLNFFFLFLGVGFCQSSGYAHTASLINGSATMI